MIRGPVKRAAFIYTRPPEKCGIATITADSIANTKLASEEGFDRIAFIRPKMYIFADIAAPPPAIPGMFARRW